MPTFVVERYVQAHGLQALVQQEREALEGGASDGTRHLRSTYLPEDELCLSFFEGPSLDAVRRVNERAGLPYERISEAIDVSEEPRSDEPTLTTTLGETNFRTPGGVRQ